MRLSAIPLVLLALYVAFAKAGFVHSPFFVITEGDVEEAKSSDPGLRVLFVGNSLTYYNDMPHMLHELAAEDPGAQPVFPVSRTRGSWTLEGATEDKGLDGLLDDVRWDAVILQERSWYLATPESTWRKLTYPYADELRREIEMSGDRPVLFATWGYRDGLGDGDKYGAMQNRLLDGYGRLRAISTWVSSPWELRGGTRGELARASICGRTTTTRTARGPTSRRASSTPSSRAVIRGAAGTPLASTSPTPASCKRRPPQL